MKIRLAAAAAIALFSATALTACSEGSDPDYARVCVDQQHVRQDASKCDDADRPTVATSPFIWWYLGYGRSLPAVGKPVSGGRSSLPKSSSVEEDEGTAIHGGKSYTEPEGGARPPIEEPVEPHVAPVEPHIAPVEPHIAVR